MYGTRKLAAFQWFTLLLIVSYQISDSHVHSHILMKIRGMKLIHAGDQQRGNACNMAKSLVSKIAKPLKMLSDQDGTKSVCYKKLGCFDNNYPWYSPLKPFPLPMSPKQIKTQFYLCTRKQPNLGNPITNDHKEILEDSIYNPNKWTVFVVHGFASGAKKAPWMKDLMKSYLKGRDANVFLTDWSKGATMINYLQAAANIRVVAAEVARFGKYLVSNKGQSPKTIHCIGHSLGAHICGFMGKAMKENKMKIDWITGLDPAGPGFEYTDQRTRLSQDDARFVDAYHTDAKPLIPLLGFGMMAATAHVDFYMNGGSFQPGCTKIPEGIPITNIKDLMKFSVEQLLHWIACPHTRAVLYYISSLNGQCSFNGTQYLFSVIHAPPVEFSDCETSPEKCQIVGLKARTSPGRGSFNVETTDKYPFCKKPGSGDSWLPKIIRSGKTKLRKAVGVVIRKLRKIKDVIKGPIRDRLQQLARCRV